MGRRLATAACGLIVVTAGCGSDAGPATSSLVAPKVKPPIHSLVADAPGGGLLLGTNRGLYRIEDGTAERITAQGRTPDGATPVGTFLAFTAAGGELLGSGHPDEKGAAAPFLGLIESTDDGETWAVVSRYSLSDLHAVENIHGRIYAYDAVLQAFLVSDDDGRTWAERLGVPEPFIDFVVDPADPDRIVATSTKNIYESSDQGRSWGAVASADSARVTWDEPDALYRADADGLVYAGANGGSSWSLTGRIDGEPWELDAADDGELFAALRDATIVSSIDQGETWEEAFSP